MALRLACLLCLLSLLVGGSAGPARAYPCSPGSSRTLSAHAGDVERDCSPPPSRPNQRKADPISFAFFIGLMIVAVLLVPVFLGKREELPPQ